MLSFMIRNPRVPIVLTGAQKSASDKDSDAPRNLTNAIQFAAYGPPGVFIVFDGKVISGVRASKIHTLTVSAFKSINGPPVARFVGKKGGSIGTEKLMFEKITSLEKNNTGTILDTKMDPNVLIVRLTPGFRQEWLEAYCDPKKVHGIVILGFGTGNIPNRAPFDLLPVLEKFQKAKIPVVVLSQCPFGKVDMGIYEVGVRAAKLGLIPGGTMTKEAAVTKLMWVLGHTRDMDKIGKMMKTNMVGELDE